MMSNLSFGIGTLKTNKPRCWVCGTSSNLHKHHVFFGTANRKKSDEDDMTVYLCAPHHNMSNAGVHFNRKLDTLLKQTAQKAWMEEFAKNLPFEEQSEMFIKRYGKSYLD